MNLGLADKVAVVSGSSRGIGRGISEVLLTEGCRVVITGRGQEDLSRTVDELSASHPGRVLGFAGDLSQASVLAKLSEMVLARWDRMDCLVANAGAVKPVPAVDIPVEDWRWYYQANLDLAIAFIQHFIPLLVQSRGAVVVIGSIAGLEDIGAPLPYSSAKAALTMYAKGLASHLAAEKVRVNCIAPGNVYFPGGNWDRRQKGDPQGVARMLEDKVPLGRFGSPEEIGAACAFLLSEKSAFTIGACLVVDGGQTARFL